MRHGAWHIVRMMREGANFNTMKKWKALQVFATKTKESSGNST
jgi:hypothetical protein